MGLSLPRELFVTDLKNLSPWEVNVAPALAGVPAHPRRIRHFSLLIPSQQQGSNAAFMLGRKWKPITLRWMLQCEVAREKQTHVLYPTSHIPCSTSHSAANPHARVPLRLHGSPSGGGGWETAAPKQSVDLQPATRTEKGTFSSTGIQPQTCCLFWLMSGRNPTQV